MTDKKQPWLRFAAPPLAGLTGVTLYQDQWTDHVLPGHPEMVGQEHRVGAVIASPTLVWVESSNPDYYLFFNENVRSPHGTSAMVACVDPREEFLVSAYYDRRVSVTTALSQGTLIWRP